MSKRELTEVAKELIAAKKRIENPENWCQGVEDNRVCALHAINPNEPSYVLDEAITEAGIRLDQAANELYPNAENKRGELRPIVWVNDYKGRKAALHCFDHAIATEIQKANT